MQKLSEYFHHPTNQNLDSLINMETKTLLFLGSYDGLHLMADHLILTCFLKCTDCPIDYRTDSNGDVYCQYTYFYTATCKAIQARIKTRDRQRLTPYLSPITIRNFFEIAIH